LIVPVSALVVHLISLIVAQYHAPRHLLPFLPVMCFVAALGLVRVASRTKLPNLALGAVLALVLPYQLYNALGTEARFTHDIRNDLAARVATVVSPPEEVTTFEDYSQIRGATIVPGRDDPSTEIESEFFLACGSRVPNDATGEFHVFQVSQRPAFYRDLFAGRLGYRLIFEVSREDFTFEQRLGTRRLLPPLGTLTPERCVIFAREDVEV